MGERETCKLSTEIGGQRPGTKRIGELLVGANVIKPEALVEALQLAKKNTMPLGRVLMSMGVITEKDVQIAIEAQSLMRDGIISSEFGIKAISVSVQNGLTLEEGFQKLGWKLPQRESLPGSELGELLRDANIVGQQMLDAALKQSRDNNLPLGRCLVLARAIPAPLLSSALTAQVLLRDGKITREQALTGLRASAKKHQPLENSLDEVGAYRPNQTTIKVGDLLSSAGLVTEGDKISAIEIGLVEERQVGQVLVQSGSITDSQLDESLRLQEMVASGRISGLEATEILRIANSRKVSIDVIFSERSQTGKEVAHANAALELLQAAGVVSKQEIVEAKKQARDGNLTIVDVLVANRILERSIVQNAMHGLELLKDDVCSAEQIINILKEVHERKVNFNTAVKEVKAQNQAEEVETGAAKNEQGAGWLGKLIGKKKKTD
jgi:hypothetical protein